MDSIRLQLCYLNSLLQGSYFLAVETIKRTHLQFMTGVPKLYSILDQSVELKSMEFVGKVKLNSQHVAMITSNFGITARADLVNSLQPKLRLSFVLPIQTISISQEVDSEIFLFGIVIKGQIVSKLILEKCSAWSFVRIMCILVEMMEGFFVGKRKVMDRLKISTYF